MCTSSKQPKMEAQSSDDPDMPEPDPSKQMTLSESENLSWNAHFIELAITHAHRSKDAEYQVGAIIVNTEKRVIGMGYNGLPDGHRLSLENSGNDQSDEMSFKKEDKHLFVCHAELNAITNAREDLLDSTLYVTRFPCIDCTKLIAQSRIGKVYYLDSDKARKHKAPGSSLTEFEVSQRIFGYLKDNLVRTEKQDESFKYAEFLPEWKDNQHLQERHERLRTTPAKK